MTVPEALPDENVEQLLDRLIVSLESRRHVATPQGMPGFQELAATLREQRQSLKRAVDSLEAELQANATRSREEPKKAKTRSPSPIQETPVACAAKPAISSSPIPGEQLRDEFLQFLSNAPPPAPHVPSRASLNFADWAMGTSGIIEPTSSSAESWVLGGLLTEVGDRRSIWIGRLAVAELTQHAKLTLSGAELTALEVATQWVLTPTDLQKSAAAAAFANVKADSAIGGLGRAIAAAQPESKIANEAVSAGILEAIHQCGNSLSIDEERANYRRQVLHIARSVFNGTSLWEGDHVTEKPTARNFDSWFMSSQGSI